MFADAQGIGVALADRLESAGHHCHLVYRDDAFAQRGARTVDRERKEVHDDFRRLLEQITAGETLAVVGVAYLWGLDAPRVEGDDARKIEGRKRDDVSRGVSDPACPCRNSVGEPGWPSTSGS